MSASSPRDGIFLQLPQPSLADDLQLQGLAGNSYRGETPGILSRRMACSLFPLRTNALSEAVIKVELADTQWSITSLARHAIRKQSRLPLHEAVSKSAPALWTQSGGVTGWNTTPGSDQTGGSELVSVDGMHLAYSVPVLGRKNTGFYAYFGDSCWRWRHAINSLLQHGPRPVAIQDGH